MASGMRPSQSLLGLASATNEFAINLYRTIQEKDKNLFFSPLSISTALAMTHLGARGATEVQMAEVFGFNKLKSSSLTVHQVFQELIYIIFQHRGNYELHSANKLYVKAEFEIVKAYLEAVEKHFSSKIESVADFSSPGVTKAINDWVSQQTKGKIENLVPEGVLGSLTRLVLINAMYFKGSWAEQFKEYNTKKDKFNLTNGSTTEVDLMCQSEDFYIAVDDVNKCLVLELPYENKDLSMVIALPDAPDGIHTLESSMSAGLLARWSKMMTKRLVTVFLPKFKVEDQFQLNSALSKLGMRDAFDAEKANFEGISGDRSLVISDVIHKAFVSVDELGSEAAAATAVMMLLGCAMSLDPPKPITFRADHPFIFIISHKRTQAVLFMGRVMDPSH